VVPLVDFESMSEAHLAIWKVHICKSFAEGSTYKNQFRILNKSGIRPRLTILRMNSKVGTGEARDSNGDGRDVKGKKKSKEHLTTKKEMVSNPKGNNVKGKRKRKGTVEAPGSEESSSQEETEPDDNSEPPLARNRLPRKAGQRAIENINAKLDAPGESSDEDLELWRPTKKARAEAVHEDHEDKGDVNGSPPPSSDESPADDQYHRSPYYQTRSMAHGTLPIEWRKVGFSPSLVCPHACPGECNALSSDMLAMLSRDNLLNHDMLT
jgi:hypothetical protein